MKKIIIFLALIFIFFTPVYAEIHWVPSAHIATIQGGINIAQDGDTVLVLPGIYYENINFKGKKILVASNYIFDNKESTIQKTIIDGSNKASVVTFNSGEDSTASIQGFTITHGCYFRGAGILCMLSSPRIAHNIIVENVAVAYHPGLYGGAGGGISCQNSPAIIEYNYIIKNQCAVGWECGGMGGGIFLEGEVGPIIRYNLIAFNRVPHGICFDTWEGGGGIWGDSCVTEIYNNTISNNYAWQGGGIFSLSFLPGTKIFNNIIAFNFADGLSVWTIDPFQPILFHNDFWGNAWWNFYGEGDTTWGFNLNGVPCDSFYNIIRDPLFVDTVNFDFHLMVNSPCIDAGDPSSPLDPDTTIADMGAFYYPQTQTLVRDDNQNLPVGFELPQNYPNPFNPTTTIPFSVYGSQLIVHSPIHTTLKIYNIKGQLVKTLVDEEKLLGNYNITWDGKDNSGREVSSGIYFYQLKTKDYTDTKKMVLVR